MADTPTGETVNPESLSNEATPAATPVAQAPVVNAADPAEVEKARKEAEQARMYANQLENKLKAKEAEEAAAKAKQLEEEGRWKEIAEQSQAKLKEIEDAQAAAEHQAELKSATAEVMKDYPSNVAAAAEIAGLSLSDDTEEAHTALKQKLDALKNTVGTPTPSANNPRPQVENSDSAELLKRMAGGDKKAVSEYIQNMPAMKAWKDGVQKGIY